MKANHTHDCDECTLLGIFATNDGMFDVYSHNQTLIIRYGDDGPDYYSAPENLARNASAANYRWKMAVACLDAYRIITV